MSAYWSALRRAAKDQMADGEVAKYLRVDLDPAHVAASQAEREAVLDEITSRMTVPQQTETIPAPSELSKNAYEQHTSKVKPKSLLASGRPPSLTKPAKKGADKAPITHHAPESEQLAPNVPATKRAFDVFSRMFAEDAESASKGSDWDQFSYAMKYVGFAARNGASSAVVFELPAKGKIVFHKPHSIAKIDAVLLKSDGQAHE